MQPSFPEYTLLPWVHCYEHAIFGKWGQLSYDAQQHNAAWGAFSMETTLSTWSYSSIRLM